MAHIDGRSRVMDHGATLWGSVLLLCMGLLPYTYAMFVSALGFLSLCLWQTYSHPKELVSLLHRRGFLALGVLLIVSSLFAFNSGEAFLQLAHFLPFFWIWAALVLHLQTTRQSWKAVSQWAIILVLATVPLNLIGILEFFLKHGFPEDTWVTFPGLDWLYIGDFDHPRTFSLFDYPNTLANYLVMILGLNLGLLFLAPTRGASLGRYSRWWRGVLFLNVPLTLLCLYCSGSRNGYLVAAILLVVTLLAVRTSPWVRSLGLAGLALIAVTTAQFGIGGRSLSWTWLTDDPRMQVWGLALRLIQERPILGHGLGNYKLLYNGEAPGYDFIAHAHNLWLMLASETGVPATILFTIIVGSICYRGVKTLSTLHLNHQPQRAAVLLAYGLCFLGSVLFCLLDVTLFEIRVNLLGWLSLAVIYASPELSPAADLDLEDLN